jgi:hypothetical protein
MIFGQEDVDNITVRNLEQKTVIVNRRDEFRRNYA